MDFKGKQILIADDMVGKTVKGFDEFFGSSGNEVVISFTDGTFVLFEYIYDIVDMRRDAVLVHGQKIDKVLADLGVFTREEVDKYNSIVDKMREIQMTADSHAREIRVLSSLPDLGTDKIKERIAFLSVEKIKLDNTLQSLDEELSKI